MPRPERIKMRERAIAGAGDSDVATIEKPPFPLTRKEEIAARRLPEALEDVEPVENVALDNNGEKPEHVRTGPVDDVDAELEVSRRVARKMGWVPKEEWKRDPDKWTDAPEFLEYTPKRLETLQERQRRMGQIAEEQAEQARREALAQARLEHDEAVRTGDVKAAGDAVDKIAKVSGPPPQTVAWLGRNPWFRTDPDAQALAASAMKRAETAGATIEEQLAAGEAAARRRFPEHFDDIRRDPAPRETPREVRLSDVRPPPPILAEGSRGGNVGTKPKEKGWMDIPSADRNQMQQFVKKGMRRGLSETDVTGRLARTYWDNKAS